MVRITSAGAVGTVVLVYLTSYLPLASCLNLTAIPLPPPTGRYGVGTTTLSLVDSTRLDPLSPAPHHPRIFVAQLFYPTLSTPSHLAKYPLAPYVSPNISPIIDAYLALPNGTIGSFQTNSHIDAPIHPQYSTPRTPAKVVIFSPGFDGIRSYYTMFHEELASRGYLVIALDHPYDATVVEAEGFPGGQGWVKALPYTPEEVLPMASRSEAVRVGDVVHVLRSLGDPESPLARGLPGAEKLRDGKPPRGRRDENGKGKGKDRSWWWGKNVRVGMYGHSLGGTTASASIIATTQPHLLNGTADTSLPPSAPRILGGINLDGTFLGYDAPPSNGGLPGAKITTPFLLWGTATHNRTGAEDPTWGYVYDATLRGWKREYILRGAAHNSFTDFPWAVDVLGLRDGGVEGWPAQGSVEDIVGTIDGRRLVRVLMRFVGGFMDWVVDGDGRQRAVLEGRKEAGRWEEVVIRE